MKNAIDLVQDLNSKNIRVRIALRFGVKAVMVKAHLSGKEAAVLALDVLSKAHLEECETHVKGLDDVALACQRMIAPH